MNKIFLPLSLICTLGFHSAIKPGQTTSKPRGAPAPTSQTTRPATTISDGSSSGAPSKLEKITLQPVARCTNSGAVTTTTTACRPPVHFDRGPVDVFGGMTIPADTLDIIIQKMGPLTSDKIASLRCVSRAWNQTTWNPQADYCACEHEIDMAGWSLEQIKAMFLWANAHPNMAGKVRTVRCDSETEDHILSCIVALFPDLEHLDLYGCKQLTANGFITLAKLKLLKSLNVHNTQFDDAALINLVNNVPGLEQLTISWCNQLTKNDFMVIAKLKNLKSLDVSDTWFDDAALINLANSIPDLEHLELRCCRKLTEKGFMELAKLKKLQSLDVSDTRFNDAVLINLANTVLGLEQLNLDGCEELTEKGFAKLAKLKKLQRLSIGYTQFNDVALINLAENDPELKRICCGYRQVSRNTIDAIRSTRSNLKIDNIFL